MLELALTLKKMGIKVEQVQDFTPTPGTISSCMFHTGIDPLTGKRVHVASSDREKGLQKSLLLWHQATERAKIMEALKELGRLGDVGLLLGERSGQTEPAAKPKIPQEAYRRAEPGKKNRVATTKKTR